MLTGARRTWVPAALPGGPQLPILPTPGQAARAPPHAHAAQARVCHSTCACVRSTRSDRAEGKGYRWGVLGWRELMLLLLRRRRRGAGGAGSTSRDKQANGPPTPQHVGVARWRSAEQAQLGGAAAGAPASSAPRAVGQLLRCGACRVRLRRPNAPASSAHAEVMPNTRSPAGNAPHPTARPHSAA